MHMSSKGVCCPSHILKKGKHGKRKSHEAFVFLEVFLQLEHLAAIARQFEESARILVALMQPKL